MNLDLIKSVNSHNIDSTVGKRNQMATNVNAKIPDEILKVIFMKADHWSSVNQVCKRWHSLSRSKDLFFAIAKEEGLTLADIEAEATQSINGFCVNTLRPMTLPRLKILIDWIKGRATLLFWKWVAIEIDKEGPSEQYEKSICKPSFTEFCKIAETLQKWKEEFEKRIDDDELRDLTKLNLSTMSKMYQIPLQIGNLENLEELILDGNSIRKIPQEISLLSNLKKLSLRFNKLDQFPGDIIKLEGLEELILDINFLKEIPPEIGSLQNLKKFSLGTNPLTKLPNEIGNLQRLQTLCLPVQVSTFPESFFKLSRLKSLIYSLDNDIRSQEISPQALEKFEKLYSLKCLRLIKAKLTKIPEIIYDLTKLVVLDLGASKITEISGKISKLRSLKELKLYSNQLSGVPYELGKLQYLKILNLGCNRLKEIPTIICNLYQLKDLCLAQNEITCIPTQIQKLKNLKKLTLDLNRIEEIPTCINKLRSLKILDLRYNQLEVLPQEIEELDLLFLVSYGNPLDFIKSFKKIAPDDVKELLKKLPTREVVEKIYAWKSARDTLVVWESLCRQISIEHPKFSPCKSAQEVIQKAKNFEKWFENHFSLLQDLEELDLSDKSLTHIPDLIGRLKKLKHLKLNKICQRDTIKN